MDTLSETLEAVTAGYAGQDHEVIESRYEPAPRASNGPALLWRASSGPNSTSGAVTVRYSVPVPSDAST